jgi:hypothetical protein
MSLGSADEAHYQKAIEAWNGGVVSMQSALRGLESNMGCEYIFEMYHEAHVRLTLAGIEVSHLRDDFRAPLWPREEWPVGWWPVPPVAGLSKQDLREQLRETMIGLSLNVFYPFRDRCLSKKSLGGLFGLGRR